MAKILSKKLQIVIDANDEIVCSAHYEVSSEGIKQNRGMPIQLNAARLSQVQTFIDEIKTAINKQEA